MNIKKIVLIVASVALLIVVSVILVDTIQGYCPSTYIDATGTKYCNRTVSDFFPETVVLTGLSLSFSLLLLSIITYWAKDELFRAWWNFAKWWVPVIIGVTLWIENAGGGGGWGMNGGAFDAFFIGIFYFIFIVVSLVKIVQAYLRTKKNN